MLYDRPYMRADPMDRGTPYLYWILGALIGGFILQSLFQVWGGMGMSLVNWFALSVEHLMEFKLWTLLTYSLLHGSFWHLLGNCLGVFFIGIILLPDLGHKRILQLFLGMVLVGGIVWSIMHLGMPRVPMYGASAASVGMALLFCLMYPQREFQLLLFFVLPVRFKTKWLLWLLLGINAFGFFFEELPRITGHGSMDLGNVAWSAHLGGMLVAYVYSLFMLSPEKLSWLPRPKVKVEPPRWARRKTSTSKTGKFKLNLTNRGAVKKEVDRILDKINTEGFASLTTEEKRILDQAKDMLSK